MSSEAATALVFDARPAAAGASAFEAAAARIVQANRGASAAQDAFAAAAARIEKAQASAARAMERAAAVQDAANRAIERYGTGSEQATRAAEKIARATDAASRAQERLAQVQGRSAAATERLLLGLGNQERRLAALERTYAPVIANENKLAQTREYLNGVIARGGANMERAQKLLAAMSASNDNAAASASTATGKFRGLSGAIGNVGFQIQDAAVQLQMGTNPWVVLAQQGSQAAGAFGPLGAVIGTVIALGATAAGVMFGLGDSTTDAAKASDTLAKAQEKVRDITESSVEKSARLREERNQQAHATYLAAIAEAQLADALAMTAQIAGQIRLDETQRQIAALQAQGPGRFITPEMTARLESDRKALEALATIAASTRDHLTSAEQAYGAFLQKITRTGGYSTQEIEELRGAVLGIEAAYDKAAAKAQALAEKKRTLDQAVAAGIRTQAEADAILAAYSKHLDEASEAVKTYQRQHAANERLVDTLTREAAAREQSERAMAVEAAARRLNAGATDAERQEVERLAGSLYDLGERRRQDARLAQAQARAMAASLPEARRGAYLDDIRIMTEAARKFGADVTDAAAIAAKAEWIDAERNIAAAERTAREAETFAQDVARVSETIGKDISENLWDQVTGEAKATDALEFFKRWLKRLGVEFLNANLIMPVTAQIVGAAPGLFGIQQPGQSISVNGQTYVPAGGGSPFGPTTGMGTIDSLASRYAPGMFSTPYGSLPAGLQSGIDDVGQLGYTSAHNSSLPFSAGEALTAVGSVVSALSAFQAFSQGRIGSGIGSTVSAGLGVAQLAGAALGPWAPIAMVAAPIIGSLLDGLFGGKPSNKEGGATFDFTTGATVIGGQEGKKFSAENRAAAADANARIVQLGRVLEGYADGGRLRSSVFVGVGGRDPLRAQYTIDGVQTERRFGNDEAGAKEMAGWFVENFAREMKQKFPPVVASAIDSIDWSDVEQAFEDLDFAKGFEDTVKALNATFGLEDQARRQAKDSVRQTTEAFKTFFETTERLWPSLTTGGTTRTETVREQTTMSAAEAIAAGLIKRESVYLGDATWETRYTDLEGRIVTVTDDLTEAVTVWKEVTKTVTEGGETIASEQARQAREAARIYVDNLVAGNEPATYTEYEAAVAALNARWAEMGPLLEMVGYTAEEAGRKIEEGLANNLANLRDDVNRGLLRDQRALTGLGSLTSVEDAIAGYDTSRRNVAAVGGDVALLERNFDAGLKRFFEGLSAEDLDAFVAAVSAAGVQLEGASQEWEDAILAVATSIRDGAGATAAAAEDLARRYRAATGLGAVDAVAAIRAQGTADSAIDPKQAAAVAGKSLSDLFGGLGLSELESLQGRFEGMPMALAAFTAALERARSVAQDEAFARAADLEQRRLDTLARISPVMAEQANAVRREEARRRELAGATDDATRATLRHIHALEDQAVATERAVAAGAANLNVSARGNAALGQNYRAAMKRFESQAMQEVQQAMASGQDVRALLQVLQVERARTQVDAVMAQIDYQIGLLERDNASIVQVTEARKAQARALLQSADSLLTDASLSPLNAQERLDEAVRQFREAVEAARGGDLEAAGRLDQLGRTAIEAERAVFASTRSTTFDEVEAALRDVAGVLERNGGIPDGAVAAHKTAQDQLEELRKLRRQAEDALVLNLSSTADLSRTLTGAIGNLTTAIAGLSPSTLGGDTAGNDLMAAIFRSTPSGDYFGTLMSDFSALGGPKIEADRAVDIARALGYQGAMGNGELSRLLDTDMAFRERFLSAARLHEQARLASLLGVYGSSPGHWEIPLPGYAGGGLVTGGVAGRDSVPLLAMPGERILSLDQSAMLERIDTLARTAANDRAAPALAPDGVAPRPWMRPPPANDDGPEEEDDGGANLVAAIDRLGDRLVDSLGRDGARQRARIAADLVEGLRRLHSATDELPRRIAGSLGR